MKKELESSVQSNKTKNRSLMGLFITPGVICILISEPEVNIARVNWWGDSQQHFNEKVQRKMRTTPHSVVKLNVLIFQIFSTKFSKNRKLIMTSPTNLPRNVNFISSPNIFRCANRKAKRLTSHLTYTPKKIILILFGKWPREEIDLNNKTSRRREGSPWTENCLISESTAEKAL